MTEYNGIHMTVFDNYESLTATPHHTTAKHSLMTYCLRSAAALPCEISVFTATLSEQLSLTCSWCFSSGSVASYWRLAPSGQVLCISTVSWRSMRQHRLTWGSRSHHRRCSSLRCRHSSTAAGHCHTHSNLLCILYREHRRYRGAQMMES